MISSSDTGLFAQEIKSALSIYGPLKTKQICLYISARFPDRCDDRELDRNNGEITWKHRVRAAQERLAKKNEITRSAADGCWSLKS
jgi:hypothetical protein